MTATKKITTTERTMTKTEEETKAAIERATGWYAEHQIVPYAPPVHHLANQCDRWLIKKPGTNNYWAEVAVLARGTLLVHGDGGDPVLFGHYRDATNPASTVHWMNRARPDDGYFMEKVRIAMGSGADATIWHPSIDQFCEELEAYIAECVPGGEHDPDDMREPDKARRELAELKEILSDAKERGTDDDVRDFRTEVYNVTGDSEMLPEGRVISQNMIFAWVVIRRLSALLKEKGE